MRKAIKRLKMKEITAGRTPNRKFYTATQTLQGIISGKLEEVYTVTIKDVDTSEELSICTASSRRAAKDLLVGQLSALGVDFAVKLKEVPVGPGVAIVESLSVTKTDPMDIEATQTVEVVGLDLNSDPVTDLGTRTDCPDFLLLVKNLTPELITISGPEVLTRDALVSGVLEIEVTSLTTEGTAQIKVNFAGLEQIIEIVIQEVV